MTRRQLALTIFALLFTTPHVLAQKPSQTTAAAITLPAFDVVSIHENKSASKAISIQGVRTSFIATNINLVTLLMNAYNIRADLMSGLPGWASSTRYDISAKISDPDVAAINELTSEQYRVQRQNQILALLTDRFHLKAHTETKTLPVYDLVVAKGGSKLKANTSAPGSDAPGTGPYNMKPGSMRASNSEFVAVGIPTSNLASNLASTVGRNVVDKTGLPDRYDITLKWTPVELEGKPDGSAENTAPDLFTALQDQLGLKLEPSKGPVETLVIDHVEQPTEN